MHPQSLICFFVDDALSFCKATADEAQVIKDILYKYVAALHLDNELSWKSILSSSARMQQLNM